MCPQRSLGWDRQDSGLGRHRSAVTRGVLVDTCCSSCQDMVSALLKGAHSTNVWADSTNFPTVPAHFRLGSTIPAADWSKFGAASTRGEAHSARWGEGRPNQGWAQPLLQRMRPRAAASTNIGLVSNKLGADSVKLGRVRARPNAGSLSSTNVWVVLTQVAFSWAVLATDSTKLGLASAESVTTSADIGLASAKFGPGSSKFGPVGRI